MSLKTIKVNPIFLGTSVAKNKTRKEKPSGVSLNQSNSIKKKLIARIKNFQQNSNKPPVKEADEAHLNDVFGDSMQFLDNLARDKEERKKEKKNTSLKKKQTHTPEAYMNIATELPPELDWNTFALPMPMPQAMPVPQAMPLQPVQQAMQAQPVQAQQIQAQQIQAQQIQAKQIQAQAIQWQAQPQPSYSNLKTGGTRPTYRTWLRTTQKQKPVAAKPTINILEDIAAPLPSAVNEPTIDKMITIDTEPIAAESIAEPIVPATATALHVPVPALDLPVPVYAPSLKPRRKRITRTLKYKLGKHANGKVSVLIKNSQTRRKVQTEQALLKQKSILDIKNDLRSKNLLKVGSTAPSDVLRHLYEQSILAGQVENKAKDTLIHNYFNDEKK
jgi:hypothetical protein